MGIDFKKVIERVIKEVIVECEILLTFGNERECVGGSQFFHFLFF